MFFFSYREESSENSPRCHGQHHSKRGSQRCSKWGEPGNRRWRMQNGGPSLVQSIGSIRWSKIGKEHRHEKKKAFPLFRSFSRFSGSMSHHFSSTVKARLPFVCVRDFHVFWTRMDLSLPTFLDYRLLLPITLSAPWLNRRCQGVNQNPSPVIAE